MIQYYYPNKLSNENYLARPNLVWVADITEFELKKGKKVYVFFCLDIFSNVVITSVFRRRAITSSDIISKLNQAIDRRFPIKPKRKLIIHTDRGGQFTSKPYNDFIKLQEDFIDPSMSRGNKPKDNAVAECFMRTFKEHKVDGKTFQERLFQKIEFNPSFKAYRKVFNLYVKELNLKPNTKSKNKSPEQHDNDAKIASILMQDSTYSKAFSEHIASDDFRREDINKFRLENKNVATILAEIAARKAEIVDKTPFDLYEDNLAFQVIEQCLQSIYAQIESNSELTREYVEEAILPMQDQLDSIEQKINELLPKKNKKRTVQPLRDPVYTDLFKVFFNVAGSRYKYKKDLKIAQLQIAYTILFYV